MKHLILIAIAALISLGASAQDQTIPFKDLPQNVKTIIAKDLDQYAATIDNRVQAWLQNRDYNEDRHQIIKGRADTYAYYLYCLNGKLMIEAVEAYAKASVDSAGGPDTYGTTILFKCGNHHGAHSTSSVNGESGLHKKYGCTGFYFQAL